MPVEPRNGDPHFAPGELDARLFEGGLDAVVDLLPGHELLARFGHELAADDHADVVEVEENLSQFDDRPVLICWGDRDFVFDHHFLRVWREHLPSARVHQFPDCGHYVLEDARDEIVELVKEFWSPSSREDAA